MELRHLRYFAAVAKEQNVSRAALKLHVSQPGLSRQIRDLEEEMGFQLFRRGAKSLHLTDAGKAFLPQARAILQRVDDAVEAARAVAEGGPEELPVGYAPSLTVQILPQALRLFQAKFPKVRVALRDLTTEEMLAQLRSGKLQVALMVRPPPRMLRGMSFKDMARYPMRVAVAPKHRLAEAKSLTLAQVATEPLLAYSRKEYPESHKMLAEIFHSIRPKPRIIEEHDGVTGLIIALESGRGVALLPSLLACTAGPRLKLIPLKETVTAVVIGAAWKGETAEPLVEQFVATAAAVRPIDVSR